MRSPLKAMPTSVLKPLLNGLPDRLRRRPGSRTVICTTCNLAGERFRPAEAAYFIALHNELHHGLPRPTPRYVGPWTVDGERSPGVARSTGDARQRAAS